MESESKEYRKILYKTSSIYLVFVALLIIVGKTKECLILCNDTPSVPIGYYLSLPSSSQIEKGSLYTIVIAESYMQTIKKLGYHANSGTLLKRAVGVAGDTVHITESGVLINNRLINNSKSQATAKNVALNPLPVGYKHTLTGGQVWLMGDTSNSYDSRYFGAINEAQVLKKAIFLF